jgi:hypothetical protein
MLLNDEEHFLPFDQFPWFKDAPVRAVLRVERRHPHHLHWPEMDVDLHVDSIANTLKDPLISKVRERPSGQ